MKTLLSFSVLVLSAGSIVAQPAFTGNDYFTVSAGVGDTFKLNIVGSSMSLGVEMGATTGSNHTWDYSTGFMYAPSAVDYSCPVPSSAGYTYFPPLTNLKEGSNILSTDNLFQKLADTVYLLRQGSSPSTGTLFFPKLRYMTFPLNYGDSLGVKQTQYADSALALPSFVRTVSYKYDGFGTVILPWGTYSNVFRIKMGIRDSSLVAANNVITYSAYYYFRQGEGIPLVRFISTCVADSVNHIYGMVANKNSSPNAVHEVVASVDIRMYPNPVQDKLYIDNANNAPVTVTIADMTGRRLITERKKEAVSAIDVSQLAKGMYLVTVCDAANNIICYRKLVKTE